MSLIARHLEDNGIPTVVSGSAIDIVEHCAVPRYLHLDFPLGNPSGKPFDEEMQLEIAESALALFVSAQQAKTVQRLPYVWSEDESWRDAYARVDESNREQLLKLGEDRRRHQAAKKGANTLAKIDF